MTILIWMMSVVGVAALVATIYSVVTAKAGVEDDLGFHEVAEPASLPVAVAAKSGRRRSRSPGRRTVPVSSPGATSLTGSVSAPPM